jgi:hypothetical protein
MVVGDIGLVFAVAKLVKIVDVVIRLFGYL